MNFIIPLTLRDACNRLKQQEKANWLFRTCVTIDGDTEQMKAVRVSIKRMWKDHGEGWFTVSEMRGTFTPLANTKTQIDLSLSVSLRTYLIIGLLVGIALLAPPASRGVIFVFVLFFIGWVLFDIMSVRQVAFRLWG